MIFPKIFVPICSRPMKGQLIYRCLGCNREYGIDKTVVRLSGVWAGFAHLRSKLFALKRYFGHTLAAHI